MNSPFSIQFRQDIGSTVWDTLCSESANAWLFHTSPWLSLLNVHDLSFAVMDHDGKPLSLVVIGSERRPEVAMNNYRAGVAHMNGLPLDLQHELDAWIVAEVRRIGVGEGAVRMDWELASMPPGPEALSSALTNAGYACVTFPSKVVDLTPDEDTILKDYRKGCRSVIKRAQRDGVTVEAARAAADVAVYGSIHARRMVSIGAHESDPKVAARMWETLAPLGQCEILLARLPSGIPVAGIMTLSYKNTTYYHAACSDPEHMESGGNTLLVHEAIVRAKARGATEFHLGPTPLAEQVPEKTYLVGRFKNQFGGRQSTWFNASLRLKSISVKSRMRNAISTMLPPGVKSRVRDILS